MKNLKAPDAAKPASNLFIATLQGLRKGNAASEASDKLAELVKACEDTGRSGTLILKLKVTPNGDAASVKVVDACELKRPEKEKFATTFFTTEEGGLQKDHPKQTEFAEVARTVDAEVADAENRSAAQYAAEQARVSLAVNG